MQKLLELLPKDVPSEVNEIRLSLGNAICYKQGNATSFSSEKATSFLLTEILKLVTHDSVYAVGEYISKGFVTYEGGIRIGIAGEYVSEYGKPKTVKKICGLVIRIPKQAIDCSKALSQKHFNDNVLIVSKPYGGKTTFLRDLARRISYFRQVVVLDERKELSGDGNLDLGKSMIVSGISKSAVYEGVLRSLSPDVVVMDELFGKSDYDTINDLWRTGVNVIASVHGKDLVDLPDVANKFNVKVLLSSYPKVGSVSEVKYD